MKKMLIPIILTALLLLVTSCASKTEADMNATGNPMTSPGGPGYGDENILDPVPAVTDNFQGNMPGSTSGAGGTAGTMTGLTTASRARKAIGEIEAELVRMSEVRDARVIAAGNTAVVALDFDAQYQAGVDKRLEDMVRERIKSVVSGIENVIVTDDRTVRDTLNTLGDRLDGEADMTALEAELRKLIDGMKRAS